MVENVGRIPPSGGPEKPEQPQMDQISKTLKNDLIDFTKQIRDIMHTPYAVDNPKTLEEIVKTILQLHDSSKQVENLPG